MSIVPEPAGLPPAEISIPRTTPKIEIAPPRPSVELCVSEPPPPRGPPPQASWMSSTAGPLPNWSDVGDWSTENNDWRSELATVGGFGQPQAPPTPLIVADTPPKVQPDILTKNLMNALGLSAPRSAAGPVLKRKFFFYFYNKLSIKILKSQIMAWILIRKKCLIIYYSPWII